MADPTTTAAAAAKATAEAEKPTKVKTVPKLNSPIVKLDDGIRGKTGQFVFHTDFSFTQVMNLLLLNLFTTGKVGDLVVPPNLKIDEKAASEIKTSIMTRRAGGGGSGISKADHDEALKEIEKLRAELAAAKKQSQ